MDRTGCKTDRYGNIIIEKRRAVAETERKQSSVVLSSKTVVFRGEMNVNSQLGGGYR